MRAVRLVGLVYWAVLAVGCVCCLTSSAWAGGLWLYEMATPEVGTAIAGRAALAKDASTAFGNPAGMTRLEGAVRELFEMAAEVPPSS